MLDVLEARRRVGDPAVSDLRLVGELPAEPLKDTAYTQGDGVYQYFDGIAWKSYDLKFSDEYIEKVIRERGQIRGCIRLIDNLITRIDPTDYIVSGNAGGQSMSFLSLSEILQFYNALRDKLLDEEAEVEGMNSGLMLKTKKKYVGGVLEDYE